MNLSYRRVSLEDQHHGPKAQLDRIEAWAKSHGVTIERDFFDEGVSGSIPLGERPAGKTMLTNVRAGDAVITVKLDRLFRSVADAATTIDVWCRSGVSLVSITEGIDLSSAYSRAMCHIMSALAELERAMIRERTKAALQAKRRRGERVGTIPFGWQAVGGKLVESAGEQVTLAEIRAWRASGLTLRDIATRLNSAGVPAKRGGAWQPQSVASILRRNKAQA